MGELSADEKRLRAEGFPALPELKPWRQVGWIFRDGDCKVIERQDEEVAVGVQAD